jgi:pimeloyl-ACP methyl ester carboxylesterase
MSSPPFACKPTRVRRSRGTDHRPGYALSPSARAIDKLLASSIYVPVLLIAGEYDTWSYPEDREILMRDLTHARSKKSVLIKDATHFVLFEKPRFEFFGEIDRFLRE